MQANYVTQKKLSVTPRDVKVFIFIETYIKFHGFSPLLEEIGKDIGVPKQSIYRTIIRLEAMGCISRTPHSARSIVPLKSPISLHQ